MTREKLELIFDKHINENDFKNGAPDYKKFVNLYIDLMYAPLVEELDEKRYFTSEYDQYLLK